MTLSSAATFPPPAGVDAQFHAAIACQRLGQLVEAEALYGRVLQLQPTHAGALHLLGTLALQRGDAAAASDLIGRSVASNPTRAESHADLGSALQALGLFEGALASYNRALAIKPHLLAALHNRGGALQALNRSAEALESYDLVLALQPQFALAHYGRAVALVALKRYAEALVGLDRTLQLAPDHSEAHSNRGAVLLELKRPNEALDSLERALRLDPNAAKALNNRGNALRTLNRQEEALVSFDRALELEPTFFEAVRNRGGALRELHRSEAALACFDSALKLRPDCPETLRDRTETLIDLRRYADAVECLERLSIVAPDIDYAQGLQLHLQRLESNWTSYASRAQELVEAVNAGRRADYPFPFLSVTDSAEAQLRCARTFAFDKFPPAPAPMWTGKRYGHEKIRIAYVSGDLRYHVVSCLLAGVFEQHDRKRFETIAISFRPEEPTPMGQRVRAAFDRFIDVSRYGDHEVAALMRSLEIDIAVDLMGFTKGLRTAVLAHRPAPVQVNYLGYPGTMGAPYIDYIVADEFVIPREHIEHYAEKVAYLPECFQANDDQRAWSETPPSRGDLSLPESALVLGGFNNTTKLGPGCFDVWMRVLNAVPQSVLWLLSDVPTAADNLRRRAREHGVDPGRLNFAGRVSYSEHLARLRHADLFLDTIPFNGGTTVSDALWAGVPVLTCTGEAFAARMAGSLLTSLDLAELITHSLEEYETLAIELARTPDRLAGLRARLDEKKTTGALFNTERFCRHLESAYVSMWERAERGEAPETFAVQRMPHA